jgi:hypothetical protein
VGELSLGQDRQKLLHHCLEKSVTNTGKANGRLAEIVCMTFVELYEILVAIA